MFNFLYVTKRQFGSCIVYWNEKTGEWSSNLSERQVRYLAENGSLSRSDRSWLNGFIYDAPYVSDRRWS